MNFSLVAKTLKVAIFVVGAVTFLQLVFPFILPLILHYFGVQTPIEFGSELFLMGAVSLVLLLILLFLAEQGAKRQGVSLPQSSSQTNVIVIALPAVLFCFFLLFYASIVFVFGGFIQALVMLALAGLIGAAAIWMIMRRVN